MNNQFAMDHNVMKQLNVIRSLEKRSETTVLSLYAQAILEYSLYHYEKNKLLDVIDQALDEGDKCEFYKQSGKYKKLIEEHKNGKTVIENGFELYLTFE